MHDVTKHCKSCGGPVEPAGDVQYRRGAVLIVKTLYRCAQRCTTWRSMSHVQDAYTYVKYKSVKRS